MNIFGLEHLTGNIAIGAIVLAAIASSIQAFINLRPFINSLTTSNVWQLIITIPILTLCYLIGFIFVKLSTEAFDRFRGDTIIVKINRLGIISKLGAGPISTRYEKLTQELELLQAACPSIGLLSIGLLVKILNATPDLGGRLPHGRAIFGGLSLSLVIIVVILLPLISKTYKEINQIASLLATPIINSGEDKKEENMPTSKTA